MYIYHMRLTRIRARDCCFGVLSGRSSDSTVQALHLKSPVVAEAGKRCLRLIGGGGTDAGTCCDHSLQANTSPGPGSVAAAGSWPPSRSPSLSPGVLERMERACEASSLNKDSHQVPTAQVTPSATSRQAAVPAHPASPLSPWMLDAMNRMDADPTHADPAQIRSVHLRDRLTNLHLSDT
jgi:hypothetical protein